MSKTVDELRQLYDDAYQAVIVAEGDKLASEEWDDMLYRTNIILEAERAGIRAVVDALRDECDKEIEGLKQAVQGQEAA